MCHTPNAKQGTGWPLFSEFTAAHSYCFCSEHAAMLQRPAGHQGATATEDTEPQKHSS